MDEKVALGNHLMPYALTLRSPHRSTNTAVRKLGNLEAQAMREERGKEGQKVGGGRRGRRPTPKRRSRVFVREREGGLTNCLGFGQVKIELYYGCKLLLITLL